MSDYAYPYSALAAGVLSPDEFQHELMTLLKQDPKEAETALNYIRMLALEGFLDEREYIELRKQTEIHAARAAFAEARRASFDPDATTLNHINNVTPIIKTAHNRRASDTQHAAETQDSFEETLVRGEFNHTGAVLTEDDIPPPDAGYFTDRTAEGLSDYGEDTAYSGESIGLNDDDNEETKFLPHDTSEAADAAKIETLLRAERAKIDPDFNEYDETVLSDAVSSTDFSEDATATQRTLDRPALSESETTDEAIREALEDDIRNEAEPTLTYAKIDEFTGVTAYSSEDLTQITQQRLPVNEEHSNDLTATQHATLMEATLASGPASAIALETTKESSPWRKHPQLLLAIAAAIGVGLFIYLVPAPAPPYDADSPKINDGSTNSIANSTANSNISNQDRLQATDSPSQQASLEANSEATSSIGGQDKTPTARPMSYTVSSPVELLELIKLACGEDNIGPARDSQSALAYLSQLETIKSADNYTRQAKAEIAKAYLEKAQNARESGAWSDAQAYVTKAVALRIGEGFIEE